MIKFVEDTQLTILDTEEKVLDLFDSSSGWVKERYASPHTFIVVYPVCAKASNLLSYLIMQSRRAGWTFICVAPKVEKLDIRIRRMLD